MSEIADLRNKIARLNGEKFTILMLSTDKSTPCYANIYKLLELGEIIDTGEKVKAVRNKSSRVYVATEYLKTSKEKNDIISGLKDVYPELFKAPSKGIVYSIY